VLSIAVDAKTDITKSANIAKEYPFVVIFPSYTLIQDWRF